MSDLLLILLAIRELRSHLQNKASTCEILKQGDATQHYSGALEAYDSAIMEIDRILSANDLRKIIKNKKALQLYADALKDEGAI